MKAKHFDRKLTLKRETIANLTVEQMRALNGGLQTYPTKCPSFCYCPRTIFFTNCEYC
ncbi:MAG: hypothetical protein GTO45_40105 [Candidatus Aminicenantes bacterium]|nr:hypothetical protein [Candidatus Aminicenantes bacterium]NIM83223.1 hypothetical protein [Candidatus Aminicenantes bacterium]NIN24327.1 hypothetical protein [Candidatus Aminicenantes bacterium]NIN48086.1 hypothetical protein [Candidatus Aminicenantes bacterium]NIN90987.1 hypothetical protein [Candidatus Aminicenantes bacterium]